MRRSMAAGIWASVSTKPSVVAMRGWIMPEPLVIPAMRTVPRRSLTSPNASLGTRSVVMMAPATPPKPSSRRPATRRGRASVAVGHDGAGHAAEAVFAQTGHQARQGVHDELGIQFDADHAGGSGQHLGDRQPQQARGRSEEHTPE